MNKKAVMNKGEVFSPKPKFEFLEVKSLRRICVHVLKRPRLFFYGLRASEIMR